MEGCASGSVDTRLLEDGDRKVAHDDVDVKVAVDRDVGGKVTVDAGNYGCCSPTVCSPTVRVDSPASHTSVRLHVKICVTTVDSSTLFAIALGS